MPYPSHFGVVNTDQQDFSQVETDNHGLRRMEEFLASILAKIAYLVIEALIVRLIRAFVAPPASPARS